MVCFRTKRRRFPKLIHYSFGQSASVVPDYMKPLTKKQALKEMERRKKLAAQVPDFMKPMTKREAKKIMAKKKKEESRKLIEREKEYFKILF